MVRATFEALKNVTSPRLVASRRGLRVADLVTRRDTKGKKELTDE